MLQIFGEHAVSQTHLFEWDEDFKDEALIAMSIQ